MCICSQAQLYVFERTVFSVEYRQWHSHLSHLCSAGKLRESLVAVTKKQGVTSDCNITHSFALKYNQTLFERQTHRYMKRKALWKSYKMTRLFFILACYKTVFYQSDVCVCVCGGGSYANQGCIYLIKRQGKAIYLLFIWPICCTPFKVNTYITHQYYTAQRHLTLQH